MYFRVTTHRRKDKEYRFLQLAESYRDPAKGKAPRVRVLAHLGRIDSLSEPEMETLLRTFRRAFGREAAPELEEARDFGHVWAVHKTWESLELEKPLYRNLASEQGFDPVPLIRLMVINRLCDPSSKLALLDWMDGAAVPGFEEGKPAYHGLLRAMDKLIKCKKPLELPLAKRLLPWKKGEVDLVLYDITSTYFEGEHSIEVGDLRQYGYSRDHRPDRRQVVVGMVMTPEGMPLCHHVFGGSTADKSTVRQVIRDLKKRFGLREVIFVGDRGMLSEENLEAILEEKLGFIVAHPLRKNRIAREVLGGLAGRFDRSVGAGEQFLVDERQGVRFVMAFDPLMARQMAQQRQKALSQADAFVQEALSRLGQPHDVGRLPTVQGTYNQIRDYLRRRDLLRYYQMKVTGEEVEVSSQQKARQWEESCDGVLLLETTDATFSPQEIVAHYKGLQELERGWRTLKSSLRVRPVHHWTERRIRAHIFLCVLALQVEWVMRQRLHQAEAEGISVAHALDRLRQIKLGKIQVDGIGFPVVSRLTEEHKLIFQKLGLPLPRVKKVQAL